MTREEEILKEAEKAASDNNQIIWDRGEHYLGFIHGAEWADSHPHWISVEDKLPPLNVFVLTCDGQGNTNLLMLAGNGRWYDKAVGLHRNITHWMPLPSVEHLKDK